MFNQGQEIPYMLMVSQADGMNMVIGQLLEEGGIGTIFGQVEVMYSGSRMVPPTGAEYG